MLGLLLTVYFYSYILKFINFLSHVVTIIKSIVKCVKNFPYLYFILLEVCGYEHISNVFIPAMCCDYFGPVDVWKYFS